MKKTKQKKWYRPTREETEAVFGPGCYIDWENNTVYGANGKIYYDVQFNREDLECALYHDWCEHPDRFKEEVPRPAGYEAWLKRVSN